MGFFGSWERELKRRSNERSREFRKSVIVGELRKMESDHPDPRWNLVIERILSEKLDDSTISSLESLVMEMSSNPGRIDECLDEMTRLLGIGA